MNIDKDEWISSISDSPVLVKRVLRQYMKTRAARTYTQILDDFFILKADDYDGMPDIKKVLEDWLDYVSQDNTRSSNQIKLYFKFMSKDSQQQVMSQFIDSLHKEQHTRSIFTKEIDVQSMMEASEISLEYVRSFYEYFKIIDEFKLHGISLKMVPTTKKFKLEITVENHSSITKEHINALIRDLTEQGTINEEWNVVDG